MDRLYEEPTVADFMAPAEEVACTPSVKHNREILAYAATSDDAVCFERNAYRLKQLELYGHKLTYDKQPEILADWKEGMTHVDIAG